MGRHVGQLELQRLKVREGLAKALRSFMYTVERSSDPWRMPKPMEPIRMRPVLIVASVWRSPAAALAQQVLARQPAVLENRPQVLDARQPILFSLRRR